MTLRWQNRIISNFEYLEYLNRSVYLISALQLQFNNSGDLEWAISKCKITFVLLHACTVFNIQQVMFLLNIFLTHQHSNTDIYIAILSVRSSFHPSVMLRYCFEMAQHIIILSSAYASPVILVFPVLNVFAKFRWGGVYKFHDFLSYQLWPCSGHHQGYHSCFFPC